jgi:hypothetical protein
VEVVGTYFKALVLSKRTEENYETNYARTTTGFLAEIQTTGLSLSIFYSLNGNDCQEYRGSSPAVGRGCFYSLCPAAVYWVRGTHGVVGTRPASYP